VIARRLARLPDATNELLRVAAAFTGGIDFEVARRVAGLEERAALEALDGALAAQLLVAAGGDAPAYDFTHALVRHTLYEGQSAARQARLHRAIAEAMEAVYGERAGEHAAAIARHYHRSASLPGAERGVPHALAAAERAEAAYAHDEATALLRVAVQLLPQSDPQRARVCGRLGLALAWTMSFDEALSMASGAAQLIAATEGEGAAANYLAQVIIPMSTGGFFHGAFRLAQEGLRYVGTGRGLTWASLRAMDIIREETEAPDGPGIPLDTPARREVSRVFRAAGCDQGHAPPHAHVFFTFSSQDEVPRSSFWALGKYRQGTSTCSKWAVENEAQGRVAEAVGNWAAAFRYHTALGEFVLAREARRRGADLAGRFLSPSPFTAQLVGGEDEWRMALDQGWDEPVGHLGPGLALTWYLGATYAAAARIHARMGRTDRALRRLASVIPAIEKGACWAENYVQIACDAAETLWLTGCTDHSETIERNVRAKVIDPDLHHPMRDGRLALARLCALQGRYDEAIEWFAKARDVLDEQGARPLRAIVDYDEALMYARRGDAGDRERAHRLLEAALAQFRAIGMPGWIRRAEHLLATGEEWSPGVQPATPQRAAEVRQSESGDQRPETSDQEPAACLFRCEGDVWAVTFAGATHRLKDTRGLRYLAQLFAHPRREFHASEIATLGAAAPSSARFGGEQPTALGLGDAGELLDGEATAQYQQRLAEVREELEEAEANNDLGRAARLRAELEFLIAELASAGRGRRAASHTERARSAVGKRIRDALRQIAAVDPALGRYLRPTVRTGTFCSYTPDSRLRVECEV